MPQRQLHALQFMSIAQRIKRPVALLSAEEGPDVFGPLCILAQPGPLELAVQVLCHVLVAGCAQCPQPSNVHLSPAEAYWPADAMIRQKCDFVEGLADMIDLKFA